jgi:hypothetical protein
LCKSTASINRSRPRGDPVAARQVIVYAYAFRAARASKLF